MDSASGKTYVYAGGRMVVVRESTQNASGGWDQSFEYFATDHLGTVRFSYKVDASGTLIASSTHDYEPFGLEIGPVETSDNTHRFTGHERDAETGNDYMHYRFYGNSIGRFMKPDNVTGSIHNPQDWNLYAYVHGNPINLNDPTGHMYSIAGRNPHQLNHGMMIDGIETWYSAFSGVYSFSDMSRQAEWAAAQQTDTSVQSDADAPAGTALTQIAGAEATIVVGVTVIIDPHGKINGEELPWSFEDYKNWFEETQVPTLEKNWAPYGISFQIQYVQGSISLNPPNITPVISGRWVVAVAAFNSDIHSNMGEDVSTDVGAGITYMNAVKLPLLWGDARLRSESYLASHEYGHVVSSSVKVSPVLLVPEDVKINTLLRKWHLYREQVRAAARRFEVK